MGEKKKKAVKGNIPLFIIKGLFENEQYCRKVINNLERKIFGEIHGPIVAFIKKYFLKYEKAPDKSLVLTKLSKLVKNEDVNEEIEKSFEFMDNTSFDPCAEMDWLYDETKEYVNKELLKNAIVESMQEIEKDGDMEPIVERIKESIAKNWDDDLGMEYETDIEGRYDRLSNEDLLITTGIRTLDDAIGGGIRKKSLFLAGGQSGVGKTLILGNFATNAILHGHNVLYITLEIDKDTMGKRIDSVFLDRPINELVQFRKQVIDSVRKKYTAGGIGRLIVKEMPPSETCANHIKAFVNELNIKKLFKPDLIVVDYMGLMSPNDKAMARSTYERGKYVSEELRNLSFNCDCPLVSAVQTGRQSYGNKDVGMADTSDSIAIVQTADCYVTLAKPQEYDENQQLYGCVVKSRGVKEGKTFILQIDYDKLKILDFDENNTKKEQDEEEEIKKTVKELKSKNKKGRSNTEVVRDYEGIE